MGIATEKYAEWCEDTARCLISEANVLEEYGLTDKAKLSIDAAHKCYAEARLIRNGNLELDTFATMAFLYRRTKH